MKKTLLLALLALLTLNLQANTKKVKMEIGKIETIRTVQHNKKQMLQICRNEKGCEIKTFKEARSDKEIKKQIEHKVFDAIIHPSHYQLLGNWRDRIQSVKKENGTWSITTKNKDSGIVAVSVIDNQKDMLNCITVRRERRK